MIGAVLPLAGKRLDLRGDFVRLGAPSVAALVAASALVTQLATFKNADNPETFLATARRKFDEMGIRGEPSIPLLLAGPRAGQPRRRVLRIRKRAIIGYKLLVQGLTAAESMQLQEVGLGGRRRMGCGFFLPVREET
jgi:CRISPR-associated protein Cas6